MEDYREKLILGVLIVITMCLLFYYKNQYDKDVAEMKAKVEKAIKEDAAVRWNHVVDSTRFAGDLCVQCPYCGKIINSDSFK